MPLRPESSVSVGFDEYGELVFDGDRPGPVIHRTPEELGLPRVVRDAPRTPSWFKPEGGTGSGPERHAAFAGTMRRNRETAAKAVARQHRLHVAAKHAQEAQLREICGEPVLLPAGATMGAELIGAAEAAPEAGRQEKAEMVKPTGRKDSMAAETQAQLVADADTLNIDQLCAKYGVKQWKAYAVLAAHGAKCVSKPLGRIRNGKGERRMVKAAPRPAGGAAIQHVEVNPHANGSAAALLTALDKVGNAPGGATISIALTPAEAAKVVAELSAERQVRFVEAGLRAALLG